MDVNWHDLKKGDLFVLSWARVRRVSITKVGKCIFRAANVWAIFCYILLWLDA